MHAAAQRIIFSPRGRLRNFAEFGQVHSFMSELMEFGSSSTHEIRDIIFSP